MPTPPPLPPPSRTPTMQGGVETVAAAASVQSPLRPPSPTPPGPRRPDGEEEEQRSVSHEALGDPQAHLDRCTHSLHLPCFCALRVRAETDLRCSTCRATTTVDQSDRRALQEHSDEVMSAALTTARQEAPEGEERTAQRARFVAGRAAARGSRVICSICNRVVEDRTYVRVVCSCYLHLRCALGFVENSDHGITGSTRITCSPPPHTRGANTLLWVPS